MNLSESIGLFFPASLEVFVLLQVMSLLFLGLAEQGQLLLPYLFEPEQTHPCPY